MEATDIFRILCVATGLLFLALDFKSYVRQKLTPTIGLGWALFSVLLIVIGAASGLLRALNDHIFILIFLVGVLLIYFLFCISRTVSVLKMKNQELAMQVSLLNQENERILHELGILADEKKDTVRD